MCGYLPVGEVLVYPSHPELRVKGSWEPEKMREEIARLKRLDIMAVPKLNFSTCHDGETHKHGFRPWIWSDYVWDHEAAFMERMPKDVLQSKWYYFTAFDKRRETRFYRKLSEVYDS